MEIYQFTLQLSTVRHLLVLFFQEPHQMKFFPLTGEKNMVKIFIDERLDMINVKNEDGETPLFFAVRCIIRKFFRN